MEEKFGNFFGGIGLVAGLFGGAQVGGIAGALIAAFVMGGIGYGIGTAVARVLFVIAAIIVFLINAAARKVVVDILLALFGATCNSNTHQIAADAGEPQFGPPGQTMTCLGERDTYECLNS